MKTTTATHIDRSERNVGIDIGKNTLDLCIYEIDFYAQYSNTPEGVRELLKKLSRYNLTRILVEATGGYERCLVEACADKNCRSLSYSQCRCVSLQKHKALSLKPTSWIRA